MTPFITPTNGPLWPKSVVIVITPGDCLVLMDWTLPPSLAPRKTGTLFAAPPPIRIAKTGLKMELSRDTFALLLAGGNGTRLGELTRSQCKPAVPFAGHFRNIDFTLS